MAGGAPAGWLLVGKLPRAGLGRHHAGPEAVAFLLLPALAADAEFLQQAGAELLEFVLGTLVDDDPVGTAADDLPDRQLGILEILRTQRAVSTRECAEMMNVSERTALRDLRALIARGLVLIFVPSVLEKSRD